VLSAGDEGYWVKEYVEDRVWVYVFHFSKDGKGSIVHVTRNGDVIQPRFKSSSQASRPKQVIERVHHPLFFARTERLLWIAITSVLR